MHDVDAVLFDLDGTLCVHDADEAALLADAFEEAGVDRALDVDHLHGVDTSDLPTAESSREFFGNLFEAAARSTDRPLDAADARAVGHAFESIRDPANVSFRDGAREALAAARERHAVGLVTNGDEGTQRGKLRALGIDGAFDAAVYCDPADGVRPKPDPRPVELAVENLDVRPGASVLVGDDHAADVAGAHNAGVRSAWVPQWEVEATPDPAPTRTFDSMAEFASVLRQ